MTIAAMLLLVVIGFLAGGFGALAGVGGGIIVTPLLVCIQFLHERDFKYALVSFGVMAIVVLAHVLGLQA